MVEIALVGRTLMEVGADSGEGCSEGEVPLRNLNLMAEVRVRYSLWVRMV